MTIHHTYEVCPGWGQLLEGWEFDHVPGVAVDSQDNVYIFNRSAHPLMIFDSDGNPLTFWGEGLFNSPHNIHIDDADNVYLVDGGAHVVMKFSKEGELMMTLGTRGQSGAGIPFNIPTGAAVSSSGEIYVSDGYGNSQVHKFSPDGRLLASWGAPGNKEGEFNLPHGICLDGEGRVYVADRQNKRIQIFTPNGEYITQWTDFALPCDIFIDTDQNVYVAEAAHRVSKLTIDGKVLLRFGEHGSAPGQFDFPHGICVDKQGNVYVGEVYGERVQKFSRI